MDPCDVEAQTVLALLDLGCGSGDASATLPVTPLGALRPARAASDPTVKVRQRLERHALRALEAQARR